MAQLDQISVNQVIDAALAEDIGQGDLTSQATLPENIQLSLVMAARGKMVIAGLKIAEQVFLRLVPDAKIFRLVEEGAKVKGGAHLMTIEGQARGLLTAERTALNLVQFLSAIATQTRKYVEAIEGTGAVLLDTRKTIPGLRVLSKYATRMGGATNHRLRLDDGVLIKDNHIAVAGSAAKAVEMAKQAGLDDIEVECDTLDQVAEALDAGADKILLDNMSNKQLRKAVKMTGGRIPLEASGGVNLKTIRGIAETGVDFISVGRITQSVPAVDIGLDLKS